MQRYQIVSTLAVSVCLLGCSAQTGTPGADSHGHSHATDDQGHGHDHSAHGPHGGHLIDLGRSHEFHAELVEDEVQGKVVIYILDAALNEVAVQADEITAHLQVSGQQQSYRLAAVNSAAGKASRFESSSSELLGLLQRSESVDGKLRITIAGKPYVGHLAHHGDHVHR